MVRIIMQDKKSVTNQNVGYIKEMSGFSPWDFGKTRIIAGLQRAEVTVNNLWGVSLLEKLLIQRTEMNSRGEDTVSVQSWIDAICST